MSYRPLVHAPLLEAHNVGLPDRPIAPLLIGPKNACEMIGQPWRWVRDFARQHGVAMLHVGTKTVIPARELVIALRAAAARDPERELTDGERLAALRAKLGLERRPANDIE